VPNATKKFLEFCKKPQTTAQIAEALKKHGITTSSKKFNNTVNTVLYRISNESGGAFVRVHGKEWGLATWYPAMKKSKKPKATGKKTKKK